MLNFLLDPITQLSFRHCLEYPVMDLIHSLRNRNSPKGGEEDVTAVAHVRKDARSEGDRNEWDLAFDLFLLDILGLII